ncbi:hypothetical protein BDQ17DRAFT_1243749 [Cyathus striatus]|nr:hypothetical protein BDQ17DRAFT_1243749 [Cyathus striatus]
MISSCSIVAVSSLCGIFLATAWLCGGFSRRSHSIEPSSKDDYFRLTGVPTPTPLHNFKLDLAKARPYRPFRWGYYQTMALSAMEPDWWIELESTYRERLAQRKELFTQHGKAVVDLLPGSEGACRELMNMVVHFLCIRYPNEFQLNETKMIFYNRILDTSTNVRNVEPLSFLLETIPEDFLITQLNQKTGLYHLTAGVSCSAVGWNMSSKIGRPLHQIHGPVPFYEEKLRNSMDRYFAKMPCNKPIQRGSWGLEIGQPLYLQPDDEHFAIRETQPENLKLDDIYLRVDWQTLRRLPKSQAIVFNFKALFTPVTSFRHEPYIPRLLLKVLREGPKKIKDYKGTYHVEHKVIPALDEWAKEQEERGWVKENWEERTLDEHPFFPGWESHC